jgi:hypothetical protein
VKVVRSAYGSMISLVAAERLAGQASAALLELHFIVYQLEGTTQEPPQNSNLVAQWVVLFSGPAA